MNGSGGDNRVYGVGRNTYRYPETWKADLRLGKSFNLGQMREVELLAESFNLFNHQNVTQLETTGYYIQRGSSWSDPPTLNFLTGVKTDTTAFGMPLNINATNFYRQKITEIERLADSLAGHSHPYTYLSEGRRFTAQPGIHAPLNFDQYLTLTPYATGIGDLYQTNDRTEDRVVTRSTGETGIEAYTRFERVFPLYDPLARGIKHQIEPHVEYVYRPSMNEDQIPIFDGYDRLDKMSAITYGLTNRLWLRLFDPSVHRFSTIKLTDLRILHGYDFAEETRALDPAVPNDERRPWLPIRMEFETLATAGRWLNRILLQSTAEYTTYQDRITTFDVLGVLGTVNDDTLGAEYRYHVDRTGFIDIEFLSGIFRYTLQEFITFEYVTRYSFLDSYFIDQIYAGELHSLQDCWKIRLQYEEHSIPRHENITQLMVDLTGLVQAATSF